MSDIERERARFRKMMDGETIEFDRSKYKYDPQPDPADSTCRACYEWRLFPKGQEHFGYSWWLICDIHGGHNRLPCPHPMGDHHDTEVWTASTADAMFSKPEEGK